MKFVMGETGLVLATGAQVNGEERWPGVFGWLIDKATDGAYSQFDAYWSAKLDIFSAGLLDSLASIAVVISMILILYAAISGGKAMSWGFKFMLIGLILNLTSGVY